MLSAFFLEIKPLISMPNYVIDFAIVTDVNTGVRSVKVIELNSWVSAHIPNTNARTQAHAHAKSTRARTQAHAHAKSTRARTQALTHIHPCKQTARRRTCITPFVSFLYESAYTHYPFLVVVYYTRTHTHTHTNTDKAHIYPFSQMADTSACMFHWSVDRALIDNGPLELRLLRAPTQDPMDGFAEVRMCMLWFMF